jgi:hypothetical protein
LRAALWNGSALGCAGFVGRHRLEEPLMRPRPAEANGGDYNRVTLTR